MLTKHTSVIARSLQLTHINKTRGLCKGSEEMVSLLLSKGANPRAKTFLHLSPLHLACSQGHIEACRLLLDAEASVDDRDKEGTTPLHLSSVKGDLDIVRLLLQCSADSNGGDRIGWTPLHYAASKGHAKVARTLLQAGANSRAVDLREKITPLHLACASGHPVVVKILLEFGADSNAIDCHGVRPDDVIRKGGLGDVDLSQKRELVDILICHRAKIRGCNESSSSLECVVDSLRAKVSELESKLGKARRNHLEVLAYLADKDHRSFAAALKPECAICLFEVKEVVLDPCRHLATCSNCVVSLPSCPFCGCPVVGYKYLEKSISGSASIGDNEDQKSDERPIATSNPMPNAESSPPNLPRRIPGETSCGWLS